MVFLPTFLKKGEHHQFLNHVFWVNSRKRIRPSGVLSDNPEIQGLKNPNSSKMIRISRFNPILSTDNEKEKSRKKEQKIGKRNR